MKQNRKGPDGNFGQRLLDQLKAVVAERGSEQATASEGATPTPAWRRAPRLALGAVAVLAAAAAVLTFGSGGDNAPRAFAVKPREGGGVTIKVYSLEDASGLERALREAGIEAQVTWLPAGMTCREPHFTLCEYMRGEISDREYYGSTANLNLDPAAFRRDQSVVLSGSPAPHNGDPEGGYEAQFGIAAGEVDPCEPIPAPDE